MKLGVHKGSKETEPDFGGKLSFGPNWAKRPSNEFKTDVFKNMSNLAHYFLLLLLLGGIDFVLLTS